MQSYSKILGTPSVSVTSSYEKLTDRITTRVMALRIMKQKEQQEADNCLREKSLAKFTNGKPLTEKIRQPSKFLLGTSLPNSTIKSEVQSSSTVKKVEDRDAARAKRDASVREIMERLESRLLFSSTEMVVKDGENMKYADNINDSTNDLHDDENEASKTPTLQISCLNADEFLDTLKEQRRIRRRTTMLAPISCQRHEATYEAIKKAIQNTRTVQDVVDVDGIRNSQLKNLELKLSSSKNSSRVPSSVTITGSSRRSSLTASLKFDSKTSKISKKSTVSTGIVRRARASTESRKSILKQGNREDPGPLRNVSIAENLKTEDGQTQTYLRMKDFT